MSDMISRQAAISAINQICPIDTEYDCTLLDRVDVRCVLTDLPSAQPGRMVLPEICILEGYDTMEDENGNKGFGVYIPSKKQIYVAGDVPQEIMLKALFHELAHWVQDISGRHFDEDEANEFSDIVYDVLPSVQPRKGKWIKISPANIYECSECGKNVMTDDISAYDFCHGCGCRIER